MKKITFYPFLVTIYPVLALGSYNIKQIHPDDIQRPLLTSLLIAEIALGLSQLVLRDWHRAALVSALILIIFFSYGHIYSELNRAHLLSSSFRAIMAQGISRKRGVCGL